MDGTLVNQDPKGVYVASPSSMRPVTSDLRDSMKPSPSLKDCT